MKILLAIDSSTASQYVVSVAATRPWPSGTVFSVLSVVDIGRREAMPALVEEAEHEALSLVKGAAELLTQSGYEVLSEIQLGFPKKAIPDYAKQWAADLVMVGSRDQSALTRIFLGSVAQVVLRTCPCSVEITRPTPVSSSPSDGMKILLATDGSECSVKAVSSVTNRPWPAKSKIRIVSVVELPLVQTQSAESLLYSEYSDNLLESVCKEARRRAEDAVADAREMLNTTGLNVCICEATPEGEPRAFILDEAKAWGADLIVLGSHGRHGWDLTGSVAESVALHAHCSVEVVR